MDVLQYEIRLTKEDLALVEIHWNSNQLKVGEIFLSGEEVNEVLTTVRRIKAQKLARLIGLQSEGATS
jgi:hypothetical protein